MLGKKNSVDETINTVIGKGIKLEVKLISGTGSIRIDGSVIGDINIDGSLVIGESGKIEGSVAAKSALVAGDLEGNIRCSGALHISGTGYVSGTVDTASIIVDDGAVFNGTCNMAAKSKSENHSTNIKKFEKEQTASLS